MIKDKYKVYLLIFMSFVYPKMIDDPNIIVIVISDNIDKTTQTTIMRKIENILVEFQDYGYCEIVTRNEKIDGIIKDEITKLETGECDIKSCGVTIGRQIGANLVLSVWIDYDSNFLNINFQGVDVETSSIPIGVEEDTPYLEKIQDLYEKLPNYIYEIFDLNYKKGWIVLNNNINDTTNLIINGKSADLPYIQYLELNSQISYEISKSGFESNIVNVESKAPLDTTEYFFSLNPKSRIKSLFKSFLLPGWGQWYFDQRWKFPIMLTSTYGAFGLSGLALEQFYDKNDLFNDYNKSYSTATVIDSINTYNWLRTQAKLNRTKNQNIYLISLYTGLSLYTGSLLDVGIFNKYDHFLSETSKSKAVLLSAVIPGFGQYYIGNESKGRFIYFGHLLNLAAVTYATHNYYQKLIVYKNVRHIYDHATDITGLENSGNDNGEWDGFKNAEKMLYNAIISTGLLYFYNLYDILFNSDEFIYGNNYTTNSSVGVVNNSPISKYIGFDNYSKRLNLSFSLFPDFSNGYSIIMRLQL